VRHDLLTLLTDLINGTIIHGLDDFVLLYARRDPRPVKDIDTQLVEVEYRRRFNHDDTSFLPPLPDVSGLLYPVQEARIRQLERRIKNKKPSEPETTSAICTTTRKFQEACTMYF